MAKLKKKKAKRNQRGYYDIKGLPHVSVTTYQRVINKPFLMPWYGRMEQKAVLKLIRKFTKKGLTPNMAVKLVKLIKVFAGEEHEMNKRVQVGMQGGSTHPLPTAAKIGFAERGISGEGQDKFFVVWAHTVVS